MGTELTRDDWIEPLNELHTVLESTMLDCADDIAMMCRLLERAVTQGDTIFFAGNGGTAAEAQHMAAEYVICGSKEHGPVRAIALTTDTSVLTASANDLGYEHVFARQLQALADPPDVLVLMSTSGNSPNLVEAAEWAHSNNLSTIALLAKGGGALGELQLTCPIIIPTKSTMRAQEVMTWIGHVVASKVLGQEL